MDSGPIVLVVDDDAGTCEAARLVLEEDGYRVEVAFDGHQALARLKQEPAPALLLLDMWMPGMDGRMLLRELEASGQARAIPIVVMTASGPDVETSSLQYPILRKPFGIEELMRIVTVYSPRLWDDDEPSTEEDTVLTREQGTMDTARDKCALCGSGAASRCPRCGGAYCRRCMPVTPDAADRRCPGCSPP